MSLVSGFCYCWTEQCLLVWSLDAKLSFMFIAQTEGISVSSSNLQQDSDSEYKLIPK